MAEVVECPVAEGPEIPSGPVAFRMLLSSPPTSWVTVDVGLCCGGVGCVVVVVGCVVVGCVVVVVGCVVVGGWLD